MLLATVQVSERGLCGRRWHVHDVRSPAWVQRSGAYTGSMSARGESCVQLPSVRRLAPEDIALPAACVAPWPSPWVRSPAWDGVWMLSALWLAPLVLWLAHGHTDPESGPLDVLYFGLTALFWIGHRVCSTWLAYCTEAFRPLLRAQPMGFVVLPLGVAVGCFAVLLPSDGTLPWTRDQRLVALAVLDYALVTHHFAAQHFGALSLYRTRAGAAASLQTRRLDRLFALGVGGILVFLADLLAGSVAYHDAWVDRWILPDWIAAGQNEIRIGAMVVLFT